MNRLELVKRLSRECGVNQTGPSTTLNQTGEYLRLVEWIDEAYRVIQMEHATWQFLRKEFALPETIASMSVDATSLTDFAEWIPDTFQQYLTVGGEEWIEHYGWDEFKAVYLTGSGQTQTGKPSSFAIKPDDTIVLHPIPDAAYTLAGEYYRTPYVMTADDDEPVFPERFHVGVMWRAMMMYGAYSQEPDKYSIGQSEYRRVLRTMEKSQLPQITWGEPLA